MPVQATNRKTTWYLDESDKTWTLSRDATITVRNASGISDLADNSDIRVFGDIRASGMANAITIDSSTAELEIGKASHINANRGVSGIYTGAAGADIVVRGLVEGGASGIRGALWSDISNYGTIRGQTGIDHGQGGSQIYNYGKIDASSYGINQLAEGSYIFNGRKGEISGDDRAIFLQESGRAEIVNHGIVRGYEAISTDGDVQKVLNTGKIFGSVFLGDGDDRFDTRAGIVKGQVNGGGGNDDYYVGKAKVDIFEVAGALGGYDEVFSTISHKLADNIEVLRLLGRKDLNGNGNADANWLHGNAGDNRLNGGGGTDTLFGKGGDDTLTGGGGADYFVFDRAGVDRVIDFQDGLDRLVIEGVTSQAAFDALDVRQVRGDLIIDFGGGDRIVVDDLLKSDFSFADISEL